MSICRARLRNISNVLTFRMSQTIPAYIVRSQHLDSANDQAVNSRLLVQWQKKHGENWRRNGNCSLWSLQQWNDIPRCML